MENPSVHHFFKILAKQNNAVILYSDSSLCNKSFNEQKNVLPYFSCIK